MEGSDAPGVAAGAEAAFASYLGHVKRGDVVDFDAFCAERPALADSLRVLFNAWSVSQRPPSRGQSIGDFLSQQKSRPGIDLDDGAPVDEHDSGVRERLAQIASRSGRYTLREEIARGGMGVILRVWDKDLRRTLAMKASFESIVDSPADTTSESVARFLDEAQITSQLDHPGIVPVHEIGVDDEGRVYFTMRLVKGKTLDQIIKLARAGREGWTRAGAVGVMVKVCEAMAYAHAKGVIHRDLKPANIMVGKFGEVYVMDWGLAKVIGQRGRETPRIAEASILRTQVRTDRLEDQSGSPLATMEGAVIGTPAYMPPEQAEGRIDDLDPRSDVYSVGALLYTLLTGRMAYVDPDKPTGVADVITSLLAGPPVPVQELDKTVAPELVAICEKAMSRDPDDRYATMVGMAEDLSAFVENRVVRAYKTGAVAELRKWIGRNRVTAAVLAALVFVVIGGSVFLAWQQSERYTEVRAAHDEVSKAHTQAVKNERRAVASARDARISSERAERQSYLANLAAAHASLRMFETGEAKALLAACAERYRGWEWRHLQRSTDTSLARLEGHAGKVTAVAFSSDGARIASGSTDKSVRIWDAKTRQQLFALPGSPDAITALAFNADGDRVAAASTDMLVYVWDADAARLSGTLTHESLVTALVFSSDGNQLATATDEGVHLWDVTTFRRMHTLEHELPVQALVMSADGGRIVSGDESGLHVWDAAKQQETRFIELAEGVTALAIAGSRVAAGSLDKSVHLVDIDTGETLHVFRGHADPVTSLTFAKGGAHLVSGSHDKTVRVWNVETGWAFAVLQGHDEGVLAVDCVGDRIVSGSADGTLRLWHATLGGNVLTLRGDEHFLAAAAFDPTGGRLATASAGDGEIRVFDTSNGAKVLQIPEKGGALSAVVYSPDGKWIVAGGEGDATARVHDARTGARKWTLIGHELSVTSVAISPDSRWAATASADGTVRVWDLATGRQKWRLGGQGGKVTGVAFGSASRVVSTSDDGVARLWNLDAPGAEPRLLKGHAGAVLAAAFSPDGKRVATAGADHTVRLWNAETGKAGHVLRGHSAAVRSVAFNLSGTRIASASQDKTVRIWDAHGGEPLLRLHAHKEWVTSVVFSPDGEQLATASFDSTARIWR